MDYPKKIKQLRLKLIMTQQEFARMLGVSYESVNRWENGKNEPTMKVKRKIVALLKKNKIWIGD
ncbi:MAG: helix-turn-helix domain-containing protein [Acholeplasmataceae bacterium]|nr:helix-turn-helix domain-containing protein [Acholeplasmataceae bacterium]